MAITFEYNGTVPGIKGKSPVLFHDKDDQLTLMYIEDKLVKQAVMKKVETKWSLLSFETPESLLADEVTDLRVNYVPRDYTWVSWISRDTNQRIALIPNVFPAYDTSSPHRLFYALDTEKLYMNIADSWEFIGSPNHNQLINSGQLSHAEIEKRLQQLFNYLNIAPE